MEKMPTTTEKSIKRKISSVVELLKTCAKRKDLCEGAKLHADILDECLLEKSPYIPSTLIHMYAKCGELGKAKEVLQDLHVRDVVSWSALIAGYAQQRKGHEALECFGKMEKEGVFPNEVTFICILKACGNIGASEKGKQIHYEIVRRGLLEKNIVLGNALLNMYAKCGMLEKARQVFEELSDRNVVSWSALIAAYAQEDQGHEALNCFYRMQMEGIFANGISFTCILKACGILGAIDKGKQIHNEIFTRGLLGENIVLSNALVGMYAKCGDLTKAQKVFEELHNQDVVSWNVLIAGYTQHEQYHKALKCFAQMQGDGLSPDEATFSCILKACSRTRCIDIGTQIHNEIVDRGFLENNIMLGIALVDMYANCGFLEKAQSVQIELPFQTVVSWNALIEGYAQRGQSDEAMNCFEEMQRAGFCPNDATFISILKACGNRRAVEKGKQIHSELLGRGFLEKNIMVGTALVDMYAKCGILGKAREVFKELPVRDIVSWNALIGGYAHHEQGHDALNCFVKMQMQGFHPNDVTFISILKACGSTKAIQTGVQIHEEIINRGILKRNSTLGTALVDMYAKCGALVKAHEVLQDLHDRDVVSWNALIAGYAHHGKLHEALNCFLQLQKEGLHPDGVTFTCILSVCGSMRAIDEGERIHDAIVSRGLLEKNLVLVGALVGMYAKCGEFTKAVGVLEELHVRDIVSWNALIAGYIQHGQCQEALNCYFLRMQKEGISPNEVTFTCILKACSCIGAINKGIQIHKEVVARGFLQKSIVLGTALVDMYARCSMLAKAQQLLKDLPKRNIVSWNALIAGYGQQGQYKEALNCFKQMQWDGFFPNEVTLLCILNACSHSRQLDVAQTYYTDMSSKYGIIPHAEHHTCMVLAFGLTGHFEKAISVINTMPFSDHPPMWIALLDACRKWGNVKVGNLAFNQAVEQEYNLAAAYVLMCNIYVVAGMFEDAEKIKVMQVKNTGYKKRKP